MPSPLLRLVRFMVGLATGGTSLSKSSRRLAEAPGVRPATGVRAQCPCPGLGVTLTKSAKLKVPGVFGAKARKPLPVVPGVIWEEGRGVDLCGGVEGALITVWRRLEALTAGDGEVARYMSKSAPSSSTFGVFDQDTFSNWLNLFMPRLGGGVRGGEDAMRAEALTLKLLMGRSASSSSLNSGEGGSSAIVDVSEMRDRCEMLLEGKRACFCDLIGEDSGRPSLFFHVACRAAAPLVRRPVAAPDTGSWCVSTFRILLCRRLPPDRGKSSEKSGSVIGEEARPFRRLEVVEAESEMVSLLLDAGLFLLIRSSIRGSMASRLRSCHPFCILTLASARRSCNVRVI